MDAFEKISSSSACILYTVYSVPGKTKPSNVIIPVGGVYAREAQEVQVSKEELQ